MQTYFGYVKKRQKNKISFLSNTLTENDFLRRQILEVPKVISAIDTGFPADEEYKNRLYDMVAAEIRKCGLADLAKN